MVECVDLARSSSCCTLDTNSVSPVSDRGAMAQRAFGIVLSLRCSWSGRLAQVAGHRARHQRPDEQGWQTSRSPS